jgi:hypothetical protein
MTTLYFFGDSWSTETGEPEKLAKAGKYIVDAPIKCYPAIVSDLLNIPYKNYSKSGSSQPHLIQQLLDSDISAGDHAIFSLTAPSRRFYYNDEGVEINTFADDNIAAVSDYQDSWQSAWVCYTLYQYCQQHSITCWFISTFNVSWSKQTHHLLWNQIPDTCWILPKTQCVLEFFDPEYFSKFEEYINIDFHDWLNTNNPQVNQFIRPCHDHPNLLGRQRIAEIVADKLYHDMKVNKV